MKQRGPALFALAVLTLASLDVPYAYSAGSFTLLRELRDRLNAVRALPDGSRPGRPNVNLSNLVGHGRSDVHRYLQEPNYCGDIDSLYDPEADCGTSESWSYRWGPPTPDVQDGPGWIGVWTGGYPWLLVFTFTDNQVTAVRWQGQR
jgi:hypothetical protein